MSIYLNEARDFLGKASKIPQDSPAALTTVKALFEGATAYALVSIAESLDKLVNEGGPDKTYVNPDI